MLYPCIQLQSALLTDLSAVDETEKRRLEGVIKEQQVKLGVCKEEAGKLAQDDAAIRAKNKEIKEQLVRLAALTRPRVL